MTTGGHKTGRTRRSRKPISGWEILSLPLFGLATLMMTADYVAVEARPLRDVAGYAPWYIENLSLIGVAVVLVAWLAFRRWLGAWVPLLAYMTFLYAAMGLVTAITDQRLETIRLPRGLSLDEVGRLESAVGEDVAQRVASNQPPQLLIRRDPVVHERTAQWLKQYMGVDR